MSTGTIAGLQAEDFERLRVVVAACQAGLRDEVIALQELGPEELRAAIDAMGERLQAEEGRLGNIFSKSGL